jgi:SAM-dependent methyltransferase
MGIIGGTLGVHLLHYISPIGDTGYMDGSVYASRSKLEVLLGPSVWSTIRDRRILDFGCGTGDESVELALRGARHVTGLDIQEALLGKARERAAAAGVADRCDFVDRATGPYQVIVTIDTFEHFGNPAGVLAEMRRLITDDGVVLVSFGPTWYHPLGGHLFSVFPWAHLVFTESALIRWRSSFKTDGATCFSDAAGGLNQMTIRRFEEFVRASSFTIANFECVPIRRLRRVHNRLTREFTSAIVRCTLKPILMST